MIRLALAVLLMLDWPATSTGVVRVYVPDTATAFGTNIVELRAERWGTRSNEVIDGMRDALRSIERSIADLDRVIAEFREMTRPKAVPRGKLHAPFDLRAELGVRRSDGAAPSKLGGAPAWLGHRQGHPRQARPARSRRRLRTWERDE